MSWSCGAVIDGRETVWPKVGMLVEIDGWGPFGNRLEAEDAWDAADFRLPVNSYGPIKSLACNVEVTGRTLRYHRGEYAWVRVKVTFVGDCEPDTVVRGYMKARE